MFKAIRKIQRLLKKSWSYLLVQILNIEIKETRLINGIYLIINKLDKGGLAYLSRNSYKEVINPLYRLINALYSPEIVLDIGANYGFISNIYANVFKNAEIIAVEPSKKLCKYIEYNKKINKSSNITIYRAICDEQNNLKKDFCINPLHSQDNRVKGESILWKKEKVKTVTIDSILESKGKFNFAYIKIDTQGFEKSVFLGAENYLTNNNNWLIKTEFCPICLEKQGTNPSEFLHFLISKYDVVDYYDNICFKENSIDQLFRNKLDINDIDSFLNHIVNFDQQCIGWVDLLVRQKH